MPSRILAGAALAATLIFLAGVTGGGGGFQLLTTQEYQQEQSYEASSPTAKLVPKAADLNAPTITVFKPDPSGPILPPVDIDVRFQAAQGATVSVGTLKVMYGFLHLDITSRILGAPGVQVSPAGLTASGAQLPSGSHKLLIQVADNLGRTARQPLEFTVK